MQISAILKNIFRGGYNGVVKTSLLANNIRSAYNVGSLFRLGDAVGIEKLYLTGYTPHPKMDNDLRPAYVAAQTHRILQKTGLAGIESVPWKHSENALEIINQLKINGVKIISIERYTGSLNYLDYLKEHKAELEKSGVCFIVGHERDGVDPEILKVSDAIVEIPMKGLGNSLNVAMAATVVLYSLIFGGVA